MLPNHERACKLLTVNVDDPDMSSRAAMLTKLKWYFGRPCSRQKPTQAAGTLTASDWIRGLDLRMRHLQWANPAIGNGGRSMKPSSFQ